MSKATPMREATTSRQAVVEWAKRSLEAEDISPADELAESLVVITELYELPTEELIRWIHERYEGKKYTAAAWSRWCEKYTTSRRQLTAIAAQAQQLCPKCGHSLLSDQHAEICLSRERPQ
jgi:hypothetical protein